MLLPPLYLHFKISEKSSKMFLSHCVLRSPNFVVSFSVPRPFLCINYTVDTCYVVSATTTTFLPRVLYLRPTSVGYLTKIKTFTVAIDGLNIKYLKYIVGGVL